MLIFVKSLELKQICHETQNTLDRHFANGHHNSNICPGSECVRHDLSPSDPNYIKVELTFKDGKTAIYEMVKYIRFTGTTEEGNFAIMVKEINTIELVQKP